MPWQAAVTELVAVCESLPWEGLCAVEIHRAFADGQGAQNLAGETLHAFPQSRRSVGEIEEILWWVQLQRGTHLIQGRGHHVQGVGGYERPAGVTRDVRASVRVELHWRRHGSLVSRSSLSKEGGVLNQ